MNIDPLFLQLPIEVQQEQLALLEKVNREHLHCEGSQWAKAYEYLTHCVAQKHFSKKEINNPIVQDHSPAKPLARISNDMLELGGSRYTQLLISLKSQLVSTFYDHDFTDSILEAVHQHILNPLKQHGELAVLLVKWIILNCPYLPIGEHLLPAFKKDMQGQSQFYRYIMAKDIFLILEARSEQTLGAMRAFLSDVAAANDKSQEGTPRKQGKPTVIMLSVKNGAGGHTAPHRAMSARLQETGYEVVTLNYDTDLTQEFDPFQMLGITFEDGSPMTNSLFNTRWTMQKHHLEVAKIVTDYVEFCASLYAPLFKNYAGKDLLLKKIIPLNPKLIVTTLAYHWSWESLAYRLAGVKTLLVASDVFFHERALSPWFRQQDLDPQVRNIHFTAMTDEVDLLISEGKVMDDYLRQSKRASKWEGFRLDDQISVIGAPIDPSFNVITTKYAIQQLREKWKIPKEAVSVCISRGKMGYDQDLNEALEGYRTKRHLTKPLILHVVCGENAVFYQRLLKGEYHNLGPNITIKPHFNLAHKDCAEIRAISIIDDIKAGGASTFEGWYLRSKGTQAKLLLTPGPELWWEKCNIMAMEKWGVGSLVTEKTKKTEIIEELIKNGIKPITKAFPDWKPPFDAVVQRLFQ